MESCCRSNEFTGVASGGNIQFDEDNPWIISVEDYKLKTPSRYEGIDVNEENLMRAYCATLIFDVCQKLQLPQAVINHATTMMHRYFCIKAFTKFNPKRHCTCNKHSDYAPLVLFDAMVLAAIIFIAAKFEEKVRKSDHVKKCALFIYFGQKTPGVKCTCGYFDPKFNQQFMDAMNDELYDMEQEVLRVLGFQLEVAHPHVETMALLQLTDTKRELGQTAYFLSSTSNQVTPFCLFYHPELIGAVSLYTSMKWSSYEIPLSAEGKPWHAYLKKVQTSEAQLQELMSELLASIESLPEKTKTKLLKWRKETGAGSANRAAEVRPHSHSAPSTSQSQSQSQSQNSAQALLGPAPEKPPKKISLSAYHQRDHHTGSIQPKAEPASSHSLSRSSSDVSSLSSAERQRLKDRERHNHMNAQVHALSHAQGLANAHPVHSNAHPGPMAGPAAVHAHRHHSVGSSSASSQGYPGKEGSRPLPNHYPGPHPHPRSSLGPSKDLNGQGQKRPREEDVDPLRPVHKAMRESHHGLPSTASKSSRSQGVAPHHASQLPSEKRPRVEHSQPPGADVLSSSSASLGAYRHGSQPPKAAHPYASSHQRKEAKGAPPLPGQERLREPPSSASKGQHLSNSHAMRPSSSSSSASAMAAPLTHPSQSRSKYNSSSQSSRSHPSHHPGLPGHHDTQRLGAQWPSGDSHIAEGGSPMELTSTSPRHIELGANPHPVYKGLHPTGSSHHLPGGHW